MSNTLYTHAAHAEFSDSLQGYQSALEQQHSDHMSARNALMQPDVMEGAQQDAFQQVHAPLMSTLQEIQNALAQFRNAHSNAYSNITQADQSVARSLSA